MTVRLSVPTRNAMGTTLNDIIDSGSVKPHAYIEIRTGTRPASPDVPATGTILVVLDMPTGGFGIFENGRAVIQVISADLAILNDGIASYFRIYNRDSSPILDGTVGLYNSGSDLVFDRIDFVAGGSVSLTNLAIAMPLDC